jgi:hypothetical protein
VVEVESCSGALDGVHQPHMPRYASTFAVTNEAVRKAFWVPSQPSLPLTSSETQLAGSNADKRFRSGVMRWMSREVAKLARVGNHGETSHFSLHTARIAC